MSMVVARAFSDLEIAGVVRDRCNQRGGSRYRTDLLIRPSVHHL